MGGIDEVGGGDINITGSLFFESGGGGHQGQAGLDHVVDEDEVAAFDRAADLDDLGLVIGGAVLFNDDDIVLADGFSVVVGPVDAALVGGDDGEVAETSRRQFFGKERHGGEILVGNTEIAVNQLAVKIEGDELVGAGSFETVDS